ncbi:MAG: SDR family NAD(P)-dependent oxidoreductase [Planctomycetota bacterium]|nr:SDR family NAD(P)-dependent oxidoreductase [Planctomycetota bacterium]MDA1214088.1 SDR family NAD(P)-dependent oxidoreductase [Planctomycetota bacterium]
MSATGEWFDRRILVTGGTSGIGLAVARAFSAAGGNVHVTGLTDDEVERCRREYPEFQVSTLDVSRDDDVAKRVGAMPSLDVLVNCAGMILRDGQEFDPEKFQRVVDVNLTGTMRVSTACRPLLAASHGSIVNIASMLSFFGSGFAPAYSSSKGGISQLTKSLAIAWAKDGIRVNAVAPGWIETPLTQPLTDDAAKRQAIIDRTPLARWGHPDDVSGAVLFLCSPYAAFITGVVLPVDGGYSVM